ncbi:MAG TPA: CBS domain-containing protein [Actinomycetota bacterium]|nr:CBS domain-containing protein [Actinomycetota bacterium]
MKRTVSDVMTRAIVSVNAFTPFKDIVRLMQEYRVSAVPVVDEDDRVMGLVSEGDLILKEDPDLEGEPRLLEGVHRRHDRSKAAGLIASELMSAPVVTVGPDASLAEAARLMHQRTVKRLPVVDPENGAILGIVSRTDLLKVFLRDDAEIAAEIRDDVIRRTLWIDPDTIRVVVRDGVVSIKGQVERRSLIPVIERLVLSTEGVVAFEPELSYLADDTAPSTDLPMPWTALVTKARR